MPRLIQTPLVVSAAYTATANGAGVMLSGDTEYVSVLVAATAVSGMTPTLDLKLQWSDDGGTTWADAQPADTFTQITAVGNVVKVFQAKGTWMRLVYTIGGTTPSFTFSAVATSTGARAFA